MALDYLTGDDEVGASNRKKKRQEKRKGKKSSRKDKRKTIKRKVARIGLAPARASFLTVVTLNLLKTGTKLARIWNKPGGKEKLKIFFVDKFGGDLDALKKAISKGSKTQISGEASVGSVSALAILATATPLMIALLPLIKEFVAGGDSKEQSEFNSGIDDAKNELETNPEFTKDNMNMPEGERVAEISKPPKDGEPVLGGFDLQNVFSGGWMNVSYNLFKFLFFYLPVFLLVAKENPIAFSFLALICVADVTGLFKKINPIKWLRRKQ